MQLLTENNTVINSPYRTVSEAAEFLRLRPQTLNNMRTSGKGPSYYKHGRRILYHIDELSSWSALSKCELTENENQFA